MQVKFHSLMVIVKAIGRYLLITFYYIPKRQVRFKNAGIKSCKKFILNTA